MTDGMADGSNVVLFPGRKRERPSIEAVARLAPSRSFVDTLIAERGGLPHDAQAGFAREFAHQARAIEAGHGRDEAIIRLRGLVDAHVAHAVELCEAFGEAGDRMVSLEVRAALTERQDMTTTLRAARAVVRGHAIAARAAADGALGAAAALAGYIREGWGALPVCDAEPRQLLLFAVEAR